MQHNSVVLSHALSANCTRNGELEPDVLVLCTKLLPSAMQKVSLLPLASIYMQVFVTSSQKPLSKTRCISYPLVNTGACQE